MGYEIVTQCVSQYSNDGVFVLGVDDNKNWSLNFFCKKVFKLERLYPLYIGSYYSKSTYLFPCAVNVDRLFLFDVATKKQKIDYMVTTKL